MNKKNGVIVAVVVVAIVAFLGKSIELFGVTNGLLAFLIFILSMGMLVLGLSWFYGRRTRRLVAAMLPGETLLARGIVRESASLRETWAILVRGSGVDYRVLLANPRGSLVVHSALSHLTEHASEYDLATYVVLYTNQGEVHLAPRKGPTLIGQPAYAQQVLDQMLADGMPTTAAAMVTETDPS